MNNNSNFTYTHGAHNDFLFDNLNEDSIVASISHCLNKAKICEMSPLASQEYVSIVYPDCNAEISARIVLRRDNNNLCTFFPTLKTGKKIEAKILDIREWGENYGEANVRALLPNNEEITFFLPDFATEKPLEIGKSYQFEISAIASQLQKMPYGNTVEIKEGIMFEEHKENFLKENPNVIPSEVPPAVVSLGGLSSLIKIEDIPDHYQFVTMYSPAKYILFDKKEFVMIEKEFSLGNNSIPLNIALNLRLSKDEINTGDMIGGIIWLQGRKFVEIEDLEIEIKTDVDDNDSDDSQMDYVAFFQIREEGCSVALAKLFSHITNLGEIVAVCDDKNFGYIEIEKDKTKYAILVASHLEGNELFSTDYLPTIENIPVERTIYYNVKHKRIGEYVKLFIEDVNNTSAILGTDNLLEFTIRHLDEKSACNVIANLMNKKSFANLNFDLHKEVVYDSRWANRVVHGREPVLDYFKDTLKDLKTKSIDVWAYLGVIGDNTPCVIEAITQKDNIACVVVPSVVNGQIVSINTISAKEVDYKIDEKFEITNFIPIKDYVPENDTSYSAKQFNVERKENISDNFPKESDDSDIPYADRLYNYYRETGDKTAFRFIEELADKNNPDAIHNLGMVYLRGVHTGKLYKRAEMLFKRALDLGDDDISYRMYLRSLLEKTNPFGNPLEENIFLDKNKKPFVFSIKNLKNEENWKTIIVLYVLRKLFNFDDFTISEQEDGRIVSQVQMGGISHHLIIRYDYQAPKTLFQKLVKNFTNSNSASVDNNKNISPGEGDVKFAKERKNVHFMSLFIERKDSNNITLFSNGIRKFNIDGSFISSEEENIEINRFFVGDRVPIHRLYSEGLKFYETSKYKFCYDPSPKTASTGIIYHASLEVYCKSCNIPFIVFTAEKLRSRRVDYGIMICAFSNSAHLNFGDQTQSSLEDNLLLQAKQYLKITDEIKPCKDLQ